ncbi:MAG: bifunctional hydroxymethylpyrimidine kinase/phosphomethylpyrimidine kinase [Clostridia bacterium]|nr:bifunctional hydroxymethylpyrimidine kinase/phosphomethylpyrimidine kinase [Clostridia bacterium]
MVTALTIAGSDCSGGAGVQADLKTMSAHGVFGMSVIVTVVAENTSRVISIEDMPAKIIKDQITAVFEDIKVDAVKIGMLSSPECINAVYEKLLEYKPNNIVVDPVMYAKNGCPLMPESSIAVLLKTIVPLATVITPNIPEAECIANMKITSREDMMTACRKIYNTGVRNVLVKGGHYDGDAMDILYDGKEFFTFVTERVDTKNTHGTGCTLSSSIASNLALGHSVYDSVRLAKEYVTGAIKHSLDIGKGNGPTNHFWKFYK